VHGQGGNVPNAKAVEKEERQYITVAQASEILHLTDVSIRRMLTQKKLKRFKVGSRTLLDKSAVLGLICEK
jgi:excisionase family DNA binding protein